LSLFFSITFGYSRALKCQRAPLVYGEYPASKGAFDCGSSYGPDDQEPTRYAAHVHRTIMSAFQLVVHKKEAPRLISGLLLVSSKRGIFPVQVQDRTN